MQVGGARAAGCDRAGAVSAVRSGMPTPNAGKAAGKGRWRVTKGPALASAQGG
jgi:hypothetical protein